ncbi:MAG: metallophosphoesterase [Actinomycetales bacterium]|nr:metallophosphoesterase [Actinomycetales bacterium]
MRFIHTSDWHLGRPLHSVGMLDAQATFLDWLVDLVRSEAVDAVVVSGDIYHRALPSPPTPSGCSPMPSPDWSTPVPRWC